MSTLTDVVYKPCVICLYTRQIFITCNQCNICYICAACANNLLESGGAKSCPTCRHPDNWIKIDDPTQNNNILPRWYEFSHMPSQVTIQNTTNNTTTRIDCNIFFCMGCIILTTIETIYKLLRSPYCYQLFCSLLFIPIISWIIGISIILIYSGVYFKDLSEDEQTWLPGVIGLILLILTYSLCRNFPNARVVVVN